MLSWSKTRENEAFFHGWDRLDRVSLETTKNTRRRRGVNTVENTFDHRHECFRFSFFSFLLTNAFENHVRQPDRISVHRCFSSVMKTDVKIVLKLSIRLHYVDNDEFRKGNLTNEDSIDDCSKLCSIKTRLKNTCQSETNHVD